MSVFKATWMLILLVVGLQTFGKGDQILFSSGGTMTVTVPMTGTANPSGFDAYGVASLPINNVLFMSEQTETAFCFVAEKASNISMLAVFFVASASLPVFGDQSSPGAVAVECRIRLANSTSGFSDTELVTFGMFPTGTYGPTRLFLNNTIDSVVLVPGDRITLQTRLSCPSGCLNNVLLFLGFSASLTLTVTN